MTKKRIVRSLLGTVRKGQVDDDLKLKRNNVNQEIFPNSESIGSMKKLAKEGCWSTITKDIKNGLNYKFNSSIG